MSTSSSPWSRLALVGLSAALMACSGEEGPLITGGNRPAEPTEAPSALPTSAPTPTPTPSPTPIPTLQSLLISPSEVSLSSDPAAPASSRGTNLAVIAVMSNQQQVSTTALWSAAPAGRVAVNDGGYVSAIANAPTGTAIVTAASGSIVATASVHVTAKPLTVTSIALSSTGLVLYAPAADGINSAGLKTSAQLVATVTLSNDSTTNAVTWSSSDELVATVSASGLVTSLGAGSATLTARAAQDPAKEASCPITVKAQGLVDVTVE